MKKLFFILLILPFGFAWGYENTYAVIVGINDYKNELMANDLPYSLNNTKALYNFLISKKGGSVPEKNICYLTDGNATRSNIISSAKALFSKATKNDRVIFYFSGHGGVGFFCPHDYDASAETVVYYSDMKSIFRTAKCDTKLLFIDACFSGGIKTVENPMVEQGKSCPTSKDNLNIAVMSASKQDEISWQTGEFGMGVFTHYIIEGLGGAANRDNNAYITIQELFYYVYRKVTAKTSESNYTSQQTPQLFGKFDLRLIVGKVQ